MALEVKRALSPPSLCVEDVLCKDWSLGHKNQLQRIQGIKGNAWEVGIQSPEEKLLLFKGQLLFG